MILGKYKLLRKVHLLFMLSKVNVNGKLISKIAFILRNHIENNNGTIFVEANNTKKRCTNCTIINNGFDNRITILDGGNLNKVRIYMYGNGNRILISENSHIHHADIEIISNEGATLHIGKNLDMGKNNNFVVGEGGNIYIGDDCLFSHEITIRGNEGHKIIDMHGNVVNKNKDVKIGNRVWIGENVKVLKGVEICDDVVLGTSAVVTAGKYMGNAVYAGIPAKLVKDNIVWEK